MKWQQLINKIIYLAGGCFWGLQDLFREQPGAVDTEVGYCGGKNDNPSYDFHPGHAETLAITYDLDKTNFSAMLDFFFRIHDPTTLNKQGNDIGSSYRSAIFYQDEDEFNLAQKMIDKVNSSGLYLNPVVTSLEKFSKFYSAEEYHQDYLKNHAGGYTCHYLRSDESLLK